MSPHSFRALAKAMPTQPGQKGDIDEPEAGRHPHTLVGIHVTLVLECASTLGALNGAAMGSRLGSSLVSCSPDLSILCPLIPGISRDLEKTCLQQFCLATSAV